MELGNRKAIQILDITPLSLKQKEANTNPSKKNGVIVRISYSLLSSQYIHLHHLKLEEKGELIFKPGSLFPPFFNPEQKSHPQPSRVHQTLLCQLYPTSP